MKKGNRRKNSTTRFIAVALSTVLLIGCAVGATLAWFTDKTPEVTNVFTVGQVGVELTETERTYKMIPGWVIDKDPKARVTETSEDCYLFVKVTESSNFDDYMTYTPGTDWTLLTSGMNNDGTKYDVYYMIFNDRESPEGNPEKGKWYPVLDGDQVYVKESVTETMMESLTKATYPTLTFQAYAVQLYKDNDNKFPATEAWAQIEAPAATEPGVG